MSEPTDVESAMPGKSFVRRIEAQIWHASQEGGKSNLAFQASQGSTQTGVDAISKGQMTIDGTQQIQFGCVREVALITVG